MIQSEPHAGIACGVHFRGRRRRVTRLRRRSFAKQAAQQQNFTSNMCQQLLCRYCGKHFDCLRKRGRARGCFPRRKGSQICETGLFPSSPFCYDSIFCDFFMFHSSLFPACVLMFAVRIITVLVAPQTAHGRHCCGYPLTTGAHMGLHSTYGCLHRLTLTGPGNGRAPVVPTHTAA